MIIVGYQGEGTLGRQLVDSADTVIIFGDQIPVRAQVHTLNGLSGHAGQSDLLRWFATLANDKPRVLSPTAKTTSAAPWPPRSRRATA